MRKTSLTTTILFSVCGVLIILGTVKMFSLIADIPAPDLSDLKLPNQGTPRSADSILHIEQWNRGEESNADLKKATFMIMDMEPYDAEFIKSFVEVHAKELKQFDRLALIANWKAKRDFGVNKKLPEPQTIRKLGFLKRIESRHLLKSGQVESALEKALLLVQFGRNIQASEGGLMHLDKGMANTRLGTSAFLMWSIRKNWICLHWKGWRTL